MVNEDPEWNVKSVGKRELLHRIFPSQLDCDIGVIFIGPSMSDCFDIVSLSL